MLAHHTSSGCPFNIGDLIGSGTISGPGESQLGSLLEMTLNGTKPLVLESGKLQRQFLEDGDKINLVAVADDGTGRGLVGFGDCEGIVLPSNNA
jgi:fumarylacetoacetase